MEFIDVKNSASVIRAKWVAIAYNAQAFPDEQWKMSWENLLSVYFEKDINDIWPLNNKTTAIQEEKRNGISAGIMCVSIDDIPDPDAFKKILIEPLMLKMNDY